ncbi:MAG TPA: DUF192 domain-containing protein [Candidatus Paceibacterota bacterium]|nr:DUF192 domain-containing protein [Candidatus Paceibacterota bacterium]
MNNNAKKAVIIGITILIATAFFAVWKSYRMPASTEAVTPQAMSEQSTGPRVTIGDTTITVTVADTEAVRQQGLSGKESLAQDEGMLFFFDTPGKYGFWMKDMHFPIDIIWIDAGWQIVDVTHTLTPETYPKVFFPQASVQYVLEVPAGFSTQHKLLIGQLVQFEK